MSRPVIRTIFLVVALLAIACSPAWAGNGGARAPQAPLQPMKSSGGAKVALDSAKKQKAIVPSPKRAKRITRKAKRIARRAKKRMPVKRRKRIRRQTSSSRYRFPLVGAFTYGQAGSRFGAGRAGHRHQGQDLAAAEGTPVVAPHAGVVKVVRYQGSGAGHYIVLDGTDEDRDYVFMHLRRGSTVVDVGDQVVAGQRLADVGNTGRSFGAHLHFEVWTGGGWYTGGKPIDPLPLLRAWDTFS